MRTAALAGTIGLVATLLAAGALSLGGAGASALDWFVYDRWLPFRSPTPSAEILIVTGADPWDRALIARLVAAVSRAGASVVGADIALGRPREPSRGGASSDALLSQATALAGHV